MAKLAGETPPKQFENRPVLSVGLQFYLTAFHDLSTDRHYGMSAGPIPWTAKAQYAKYYGLTSIETERFFTILDRLDADYLTNSQPKTKKNGNPKRPS
jgi:hypothetical protein